MCSRFSFTSKFVEWEKISKYENSNLSLVFSTQSILFINLKTFSFIEFHETLFSPRIVKTQFQPNLMKDILESNETCFFMILHENLIIWSHVHFFSVFGRIFTAHTWFWLFSEFVKLVSLSTCSTPNHMRCGNQKENFSKCTINLPENFHHF